MCFYRKIQMYAHRVVSEYQDFLQEMYVVQKRTPYVMNKKNNYERANL